ncbi:MAG: ABC transporter permease [Candidatus Bathyarchaeia archaeon]
MESPVADQGIKGIIKELLSYKSGIFGLLFLFLLIGISIYTVATIPYSEAVSLWRGEGGVWRETPRNARPSWMNYLGYNLPKSIKLNSTSENAPGITKRVTHVPGSEIKLFRIILSFDYNYDEFPNELNLFFDAKYNESSPLLNIYWIKPNNAEIKLLDYIPKGETDQLYLSANQKVGAKMRSYVTDVLGHPPKTSLPTEKALFAVEDESMSSAATIQPMKGRYKMVIEGTIFGEESDIDAKMVLYGKVYGMAGTDHLRRDLMIGLLWGTPIALAFGVSASLTISLVQLILATISGYYGGWVDSIIQRVTELYMILPFLPILIMIAAFYRIDIWILLGVIVVLSIFGGGIKSTRALVLQIKEYPYIEAAQAYGASSARIVFLYIIPKILPPIVPGLIGSVPGYVFLEAALAFLGLGDPQLPTWGKIINDSFVESALYKGYYYWVLEPALMLVLTAFAFSFLGFALDKIINPKLKEV